MTAIDLGEGTTITPVECEGYVCWEVTGHLDVFRSPRLSEVVTAACRVGRCHHLVDLSGVNSLDASAVRALIALHKLVRPEGRLVVAAVPGSPVWSVLMATGAACILHLCTQRGDAAATLTAADVFGGCAC
jgi:anti-anti-sigma factor